MIPRRRLSILRRARPRAHRSSRRRSLGIAPRRSPVHHRRDGFFGIWLLNSFAHVNVSRKLGASAVVLSRDPAGFLNRMPGLAHDPSIQFIQGDVKTFPFPPGPSPTFCTRLSNRCLRLPRIMRSA